MIGYMVRLVAVLLALAAGAAAAHEFKVGTLTVEHPWARASVDTSRPTAAYLNVRNDGDADDELIGVSSPAAGRAEIHQTKMENGVMKMLPTGAIVIPAGQTLELKPGGYHVMLMDLKRPLREGDVLPLILTFRKAGNVEVEVSVEKIGATMGGQDHGEHGGMKTK